MSRLVWAAKAVLCVGDYHIGVRTSSPHVTEALLSVFDRHVVRDAAAPANFAVHESKPELSNARPVYRVFKDCHNLHMGSSLPRSLGVLAGWIDEVTSQSQPGHSLIRLEAVGLISSETAVLGPWTVPYRNPSADGVLRRSGVGLLERTSVLVDPESSEIVVPALRLELCSVASSVETLEAGGCVDITPAGRYPILAWLFEERNGSPRAISRAEAVARATRLAYRYESPTVTLSQLAQVVQGVPELLAVAPELTMTVVRRIVKGRWP